MERSLLMHANCELAGLLEEASEFIKESKSQNTVKAYRAAWNDFTAWCTMHRLQSLPASPETVVAYLTDQARTHKVSTLQLRLAAISEAHQVAGHEKPTEEKIVRLTMRGIRRTLGTKQKQAAAAITPDVLAMVAAQPRNLLGIRNTALLLVGFAGAFRRSELVNLDVEDVDFRAEGLVITIRRSKTDQEGEGQQVAIPYGRRVDTCPVQALRAWLDAAGITEGPIFRSVNRHGQVQPGRLSDQTVRLVVKKAAEAAGLDATKYSGHSLRAGLATSAAANGVEERDIQKQTRHKSVTVLRRYIRDGELFRDNAAGRIGL